MMRPPRTPHRRPAREDEYASLSLWQPWASLVAVGAKRIETRSWATDYRGWVAIHATKKSPLECWQLCNTEPFRTALCAIDETGRFHTDGNRGVSGPDLPQGAIVAFAHLAKCARISGGNPTALALRLHGAEFERAFGDYTPGRVAWIFDRVVAVPEPIPASGGRGLWHWECPERDRARVRELLAHAAAAAERIAT